MQGWAEEKKEPLLQPIILKEEGRWFGGGSAGVCEWQIRSAASLLHC